MSISRWALVLAGVGSLIIVALGCAPTVARPVSTAATGPNLLKNGGFEQSLEGHEWMPAGWDSSRAGLPTVFFGRDTLSPHSGSYSASVANASTLYPMAHNWYQLLRVAPDMWGKDLVFSVWTRSNGIEGRAYVKVEVYRDTLTRMAREWSMTREEAATRLGINAVDDPAYDLGWSRQFFSENETGWVRREVRVFVPPSVNVAFVRCGLLGTGQLMIDDASLTLETARPVPELPQRVNLLADPGFEGDGNAWEYSLPPYIDMRADRDTVVYHSGKASLRMTSPPAGMVPGKAGVAQVLGNRNLAGKRIRFSGYIKTDSLRSSAFLKLYCHTVSGVVQGASTDIFSGTVDWKQTDLDMEIPPDTYTVWAWFSYVAPAPGRVYFDDASFVVLGSSGKR